MKKLWLLFGALAACTTPARPGEAGACDMAEIKSLDYCAGCYKVCPENTVEKGHCIKCGREVTKVEACVKTYYHCSKHVDHAAPCADNAAEQCCEKRTDVARLEYRCTAPKCTRWSNSPDTCPAIACPNYGKPMVKSCSAGGMWPHGGSEPKPYAPPKQ